MFSVPLILNEVCPPRTSFGVTDAPPLELHTKNCIEGEENRVQPPGDVWAIKREGNDTR